MIYRQMARKLPGEVSGHKRTAGAGRPVCRQVDVRVLATGESVEGIIQEEEEGVQRQLPLERRLERAREHILKDCEQQDVSLGQLRSRNRWRSMSRFRSRVARQLVEELWFTLAAAG